MWAARNKDGGIHFFQEKPYYDGIIWRTDDPLGVMGFVYDALPDLTFENSPQEVELKIKEK